jgi:predicted short-subunit dehydrogenase-like oxidoreductase (DUF2520 family)
MQSVSIVGTGRMGGALAIALSKNGFVVDNLLDQGGQSAPRIAAQIGGTPNVAPLAELPYLASDITLITTPDPEIATVAESLSGRLNPGAIVLHASGSLSSSILSRLHNSGAFVGSMHPLISVSDPLIGASRFRGAYFCVEGDARAISAADDIVESLGGIAFTIDTAKKSLYHAAAVTASGHLVAVVDIAVEMLTNCGVEAGDAKKILMPLVQSTVENLGKMTISRALTGSYARGDAAAVERHLSAIQGAVSDEATNIYLALAERSLEIAERSGIDVEAAQKIRELISIAKRNHEC